MNKITSIINLQLMDGTIVPGYLQKTDLQRWCYVKYNSGFIVGQFTLVPWRANELPPGFYFRNGNNYLLDSPQGYILDNFSNNYKADHNITIKKINSKKYINVPNAFAQDGRGYFERLVDGTTRQVGNIEDDAMRKIYGQLYHVFQWYKTEPSGVFTSKPNIAGSGLNNRQAPIRCEPKDSDYPEHTITLNTENNLPISNEIRPINLGLTPIIYLGI